MNGISTEGTDNSGIPSKPCGVAILAADRLSGLRACRDLPPGIPRSIVTIKDRCRGGLIESMDPVSRLDQVTGSGTPPKNAGRIAAVPAGLGHGTIDDPVFDHSSISHFIDWICRDGFAAIFDGLNDELLAWVCCRRRCTWNPAWSRPT